MRVWQIQQIKKLEDIAGLTRGGAVEETDDGLITEFAGSSLVQHLDFHVETLALDLVFSRRMDLYFHSLESLSAVGRLQGTEVDLLGFRHDAQDITVIHEVDLFRI